MNNRVVCYKWPVWACYSYITVPPASVGYVDAYSAHCALLKSKRVVCASTSSTIIACSKYGVLFLSGSLTGNDTLLNAGALEGLVMQYMCMLRIRGRGCKFRLVGDFLVASVGRAHKIFARVPAGVIVSLSRKGLVVVIRSYSVVSIRSFVRLLLSARTLSRATGLGMYGGVGVLGYYSGQYVRRAVIKSKH